MIESFLNKGNDTPEDEAANLMMAKAVGDFLLRNYPDHQWHVNADIRGGVVNIWNPRVSTRFGYTIRVHDWLQQNLVQKEVMIAGGEILERAGMRRGRFNPEEYAAIPKNLAGEILPARG